MTNEIAEATFGVGIKEHKKLKDLEPKFKNQNLRDHMTDLELIFGMLGERVATEITQNKNSKGFEECKDSAIRGGKVAGKARVDAEREIGKPIVSGDNYLDVKSGDQIILKKASDFSENIEEDLEFAKRTEEAYKRIEAGEFVEMEFDDFIVEMENGES